MYAASIKAKRICTKEVGVLGGPSTLKLAPQGGISNSLTFCFKCKVYGHSLVLVSVFKGNEMECEGKVSLIRLLCVCPDLCLRLPIHPDISTHMVPGAAPGPCQ